MKQVFVFSKVIIVAAIFVTCTGEKTNKSNPLSTDLLRALSADQSKVIARVDGTPIFIQEVEFLLEDNGLGLTVEQAVDKVLQQQILANEAERRGYGRYFEVAAERDKALVRALFNSIDVGATPDSISDDLLQDSYKKRLKKYVHGELRRVSHVVALTGKKKAKKKKAFEDDSEAESVAQQIANSVKDVTSEEQFIEIAEFFKMEYGHRLKIESLPPFAEDDTKFARSFVEAAFALDGQGLTSTAFKTKFGWHVLFVTEQLPPENIKFEKVRAKIADELVPYVKKKRFDEISTRLFHETNIFILDEELKFMESVR